MTDRPPAITVVIPVLDGATTIGIQLAAVLGQAVDAPFEVVVVDSGSTDGTPAVVTGFGDPRVRLVHETDRPRNAGAAKNTGVRVARAPLIAFCDADDLVADGWLAAVLAALQDHPVVSVTAEHGRCSPGLSARSCPAPVVEHTFGGRTVFSGGAFGITRDVYLAVGGFDPDARGAVDYEFALRLHRLTGLTAAPSGAVVHVRLRSDPVAAFRTYRRLHASLVDLEREYADSLEVTPRTAGVAARDWRDLARATRWLREPDLRVQFAWLAALRVGELRRVRYAVADRRRAGRRTPGRS